MKTIELEKLFIGGVVEFSRDMLLCDPKVEVETVRDHLQAKIRGYVLAESESVRRVEWSMPADWWQAFKDRWFKGWLLRKYPVKYKVMSFDVKCVYPYFRPALPKEEYRLLIPGVSEDWDE